MKCYVCGSDAEVPFLEAKSSNYNETYIKQKIQNSCEEFDRIALEDKQKYEMTCPKGFFGCMLNVGVTGSSRTCSEFALDDCKKANNEHFCYCNRELCNGMNAESIIEKYGDINDEGDENGDEDLEEGSGSDELDDDDSEYNHRSTTSRKIDFSETSTTEGNKFAILSVSPATQPTINKAVNSHLSRNLLIFLFVVRFFIVSLQN